MTAVEPVQTGRPIKVMISHKQFAAALRADGNMELKVERGRDGLGPVVAIHGELSGFARFMVAASAHFGPYDAAMLAHISQWHSTDGGAATMTFAFPGLELY